MRRFLYVMVALSVAACSGGSKGQAGGSTRPAPRSSAATTTMSAAASPASAPSTRVPTPTAASRTVSATTGQATPTTPSPAPKSTKATAPNLKAQMLALEDLPAGWSAGKAASDTSGEPGCLKKLDDLTKKRAASAEVQYQASAQGLPMLLESIDYVRSGAAADFVQVQKALQRCGKISLPTAGTELTGRIVPMSFPRLGDESKAYQMALSGVVNKIRVTAGFDILLMRLGGEEITLMYATLGVPGIRDFQAATKLAVDKIQGSTTT